MEEEEKILDQSRGLHAGEWRESGPQSCLCKIGQNNYYHCEDHEGEWKQDRDRDRPCRSPLTLPPHGERYRSPPPHPHMRSRHDVRRLRSPGQRREEDVHGGGRDGYRERERDQGYE